MHTHTVVKAKFQEQPTAKDAELSQMSGKHSELINGLSHVKSQNEDWAITVDNLKSVAGKCERRSKCAGLAPQCDESTTTPSTDLFFAPLAEQEDYKSPCEV